MVSGLPTTGAAEGAALAFGGALEPELELEDVEDESDVGLSHPQRSTRKSQNTENARLLIGEMPPVRGDRVHIV
jgi:hypothetical protein